MDGFKDLAAEEVQTQEEYDSAGNVKRRRQIVSDIVIYRSQLDSSTMAEYRNVRMVDGVPVAGRDERVVKLFERLVRARSVSKELDRISREGARYNLDYSVYGLALTQGITLYEPIRQAFKFETAGLEQIDGRDAVVLNYQQVAQSPGLAIKLSLPSELKGAESYYRGRLWLDARTAQIWREERELTLRHPAVTGSLTVMRFAFLYNASRFGIPTPRRIVVTSYHRLRRSAGASPELAIAGRITFEYGDFKRFNVLDPKSVLSPGDDERK